MVSSPGVRLRPQPFPLSKRTRGIQDTTAHIQLNQFCALYQPGPWGQRSGHTEVCADLALIPEQNTAPPQWPAEHPAPCRCSVNNNALPETMNEWMRHVCCYQFSPSSASSVAHFHRTMPLSSRTCLPFSWMYILLVTHMVVIAAAWLDDLLFFSFFCEWKPNHRREWSKLNV